MTIREILDFCLNNLSVIVMRGVQQVIANHLGASVKVILRWSVEKSNHLLNTTKGGLFYLVGGTLLLRFLNQKIRGTGPILHYSIVPYVDHHRYPNEISPEYSTKRPIPLLMG